MEEKDEHWTNNPPYNPNADLWDKSDRRWFAIPWVLTILQLVYLPTGSEYESIVEVLDSRSTRVEWVNLALTLTLTWVIFLGYRFIFVKESK